MRPPSYLVTSALPVARAALLKQYNVTFVSATEREFFDDVFDDAAAEIEQGRVEIRRRYAHPTAFSALKPVASLRTEPGPDDLSVFLRGREPTWQDLISGFAIERVFDGTLLAEVLDQNAQTIVLTGTAATGKSTSAMRLALAFSARGSDVHVYDANAGSLSVGAAMTAIRAVRPDVLLIDDIDFFGDSAAKLLTSIAALSPPPIVISTIRSSRLQSLDLPEQLGGVRLLERTVPSLQDADIDRIIEALTSAGLLGRLAGLDQKRRRAIFHELAGRQLLVAMYYATYGEKLEDKVHSECADLGGASRLAYGMAALATAERQWVTVDELLVGIASIAGGVQGNAVMNDIKRLIERDLLNSSGAKELRVRHRWIAETALDFYISNGLIGDVVKGLAFAMAVRADAQMAFRSRERRLLRRLVNHEYLQRLTADVALTREIYSFLQDQLRWDPHYWLQRGSLEVEIGDLELAESFLNSAKSLSTEPDFRIDNEYAYLMLKKAAGSPRSSGAAAMAEQALLDLEHLMRVRGKDDSYSFHVYGSQGLSWARRAPISIADKKVLLRRLIDAVKLGRELHPRREDLRQLEVDLNKDLLMLATM